VDGAASQDDFGQEQPCVNRRALIQTGWHGKCNVCLRCFLVQVVVLRVHNEPFASFDMADCGDRGDAFLYVPLAIVVIYSFNDSQLNAEWVGFTLDWYRKLFADEEMLHAAGNSLVIALMSSVVSTVLGTMAGFALHRYKLRILQILVLTPIAIPEILVGVSLLIFFVMLNLTLGMVSVTLAHIAFSLGFVAIVVRSRLSGMDESLTEAARDCGATPWQAFRRVTLPLIMPGVVAGALMAFTLSIDDFVITFFTAGANTQTLPLQIYSMIKIAVTPEVNAVSTLLMGLTLFLIVIASKLSPGAFRS
jgi:spermidine/putrescine transport system permease protein